LLLTCTTVALGVIGLLSPGTIMGETAAVDFGVGSMAMILFASDSLGVMDHLPHVAGTHARRRDDARDPAGRAGDADLS